MKFMTYLVTHYNDGRPVNRKEREAILISAWQEFGGYTFSGPQTGAWGDETGKLYAERSYRLEVVTERSKLNDAINWVKDIGRRLKQKAMYFEVRDYDGVQIIDLQ